MIFAPIFLIGSIHRIIEKLLAGRLKKIICKLVFFNQYAFIHNRSMLYDVLVINQLVKFSIRNKKEMFLFKVDFEKAFDLVSWDYLLYILKRMKFGTKWIKWIKARVSSKSLSIIINGSSTINLKLRRGLRQFSSIQDIS